MHGFLYTDLHEVCWHFATHESVRPSGFYVQLTEWICQRTHSKCFYSTLIKQIQTLYPLKMASKFADLLSTIPMTAHCFGALSQVHAIWHCVIGQKRDIIWPDWLNWYVWWPVSAFEIQSHSQPKITNGQASDKTLIPAWISKIVSC